MRVTTVPILPEVGVKVVIVGGLAVRAVKLPVLVAEPAGVVTSILPVLAPTGTSTLIVVDVSLEIDPDLPSKVTLVAPERWVPVMVTAVPGVPEVGVKLEIFGVSTVKLPR